MRYTLLILALLASPAFAAWNDVTARYIQNEEHDYAAHRRAGKLLALVSADWCQHCESVKQSLDTSGLPYAIVDADSDLGMRIHGAGPIPALYYWADPDKPGRRLVGSHSLNEIQTWLENRRPVPLRNSMCNSRGCSMCVGIALANNYGVSYSTTNQLSHADKLAMWDRMNADTLAPTGAAPPAVVEAMLDMADVQPGETLYDLGSGDGRIVRAAAERGATAVGIEIDGELVAKSRQDSAGEQQVSFLQGDVTESDFSDADVVTAYLTPNVTSKVDWGQLRAGTRIVACEFPLPGWTPLRTRIAAGKRLYLYSVPTASPSFASESGSPARRWGFPVLRAMRGFCWRCR